MSYTSSPPNIVVSPRTQRLPSPKRAAFFRTKQTSLHELTTLHLVKYDESTYMIGHDG